MAKLFGTDGIRGIANQEPITPDMGLKLGRALVQFCRRQGKTPVIVIGRDTRKSGEMLEFSVASGVISAGGDVYRVGELPTPAVAFLTRDLGGGAGVVISASHNPHEYNGFKLFSHEGFKISEEEELELEELISSRPESPCVDPGLSKSVPDAGDRYVSFLARTVANPSDFADLKVVLDCANGATYQVAPAVFRRLGARVQVLSDQPDGENINRNCGSEHPEPLTERVLKEQAQAGLAFDGDGDRLVAVDEKGEKLTGDQILTVCAKSLRESGRLSNNVVVSTVMSNLGFRVALRDLGIAHVSTPVGDRNVVEEMRAKKAVLGGEDSGHLIFLAHHTTGDGLLSALQLLSAMQGLQRPLSELSTLMRVFPQTLLNVPVQRKPEIPSVPEVVEAIRSVEARLGNRGRVLVRHSGTEPVCRVMVEGERQEEIERYASEIGETVRRNMG